MVNKSLNNTLLKLPRSPGVYFHKDKKGEIIYIGKAAVLKNRVKSYFQNLPQKDIKTQALVAEIVDVDWIETASELDALFLESEMVKRYKPRYNILLRDDKSQLFVRINMKDEVPFVTTTRQPADDGADYWGPYFNGFAVTKALRLLRRVFPYYTRTFVKKTDFDFHLKLSPGVEKGVMTPAEYKKSLRQLIRCLKGERKSLLRELEKDMKQASRHHRFEEAAVTRNKIRYLGELQRQIIFGRDEFLDISKDQALAGLADLLGLQKTPRRIEGYDISHMSGTLNAASMVVSTNGIADKAQYRKFKLRLPGNDDFAHMNEALTRRFSESHKDWPWPDLILIDGGKGQLDAALSALEKKNLTIPVIGLAKRLEEIVIHRTRSHVTTADSNILSKSSQDYVVISLPKNSAVIKLLQRIRDESHRFAISYHTTLKRRKQTASVFDEIAGIGPVTRKKLIKKFGSVGAIKLASESELSSVIGLKKSQLIRRML